ncbi:DUF5990 family protein [Hamadaea sp. NPDC051192]|uniref:DUF5990 family protein n=1 Tax=Hamadaea sp. NPDC051192 TaxID=3154940 RepID=UPI0034296507
MRIRIEGRNLPGRPDVAVGVQRRDKPAELLGVQPGDAAEVAWELTGTAAKVVDGRLDVRGPHIQGGPGQRFVNLTWLGSDGVMFRRAKLWLDGIDPATAEAALAAGQLTARLGLTDPAGGPVCASVRPPLISWTVD